MKKKNYFIILSILVVTTIILAVLLSKLGRSQGSKRIRHSEEYKYYASVFSFTISDDNSYYIINDIKKNHYNDVIITIPNTIDDIPVKMFTSNNDFFNFVNIKKVFIGKNIEYIGPKLFLNSNSNIYDIEVHEENLHYSSLDGVLYSKDKTILLRYPNGKSGESGMLNFTVPESVNTIAKEAFYNNKSLTSITLSSNLLEIEDSAFYNCRNLVSINFNNKIETIGVDAFKNCNFKSVELPNSLKSIKSRAFSYNPELLSIYIPSSVNSFGNNIVSGCPLSIKIYTDSGNLEVISLESSFKGKTIIER